MEVLSSIAIQSWPMNSAGSAARYQATAVRRRPTKSVRGRSVT